MRWTKPRRGTELNWIEDRLRGDSVLVVANQADYRDGVPLQPDLRHYETDRTAGLALRLARTAPDPAGMMSFTRRYGLLLNQRLADGRLAGSLQTWRTVRDKTRQLIGAWFKEAPDIRHAAELRAAFSGEPPQFGEPVRVQLNDILLTERTQLIINAENVVWPNGPTLQAQLFGELAIRIATRRPFFLCARCGSPFVFQRTTSMYCSNTCRAMAVRERRAHAGRGRRSP
jgi:hypothetical protein